MENPEPQKPTETPGSILNFNIPITVWINEKKSIDSVAKFPTYIHNM